MTQNEVQSSVPGRRPDELLHDAPEMDTDRSIRQATVTAGVGLLLLAALAGFGYAFAIAGLVTDGDAARTAEEITSSDWLFRLGIMTMFLAVVLDIVIAWALFHVFRPVSAGISMLAAWFRLAYAAVFLVAVSQLPGVLYFLSNSVELAVFSTAQLQTQALLRINDFNDVWDAGLVLFGFHLLVIAYLAYRSGFVPRLLGVLLAIAGFGYVFDSLVGVLSRGSTPDISAFTFIGEFLLALWLVIWGRRITSIESEPHDDAPAP